MKKSLKMAFVVAGIAIASFTYISKVSAKTQVAGDCVGSGNCGTTSQGTELVGKWHEGTTPVAP